MLKKEMILFSAILVLFLFLVSCAPKQAPAITTPTTTPTPTEEAPATGEAPVDEVAEDISDTGSIDEELSTNDLDDVDSLLSDIENI